MKSKDIVQTERQLALEKVSAAIEADNQEEFVKAFTDFADSIQDNILQEARGIVGTQDAAILSQRGVRQLTSEENQYYSAVIDAMRSPAPLQALSNLDVVMPKTTIDSIFEDLAQMHPLLDAINFMNTSEMTEFLLNTNTKQLATWSTLTATITKELTSGFKKVDLHQKKLSAWIPVANAMLDLGPAWLDRYVRVVLSEALAYGLEEGIVNGTGNGEPIGMIRQVGAGVTVTDGVYPVKTATAITDFNPETFGSLISAMAATPNGNYRVVDGLIMVVNPVDYLQKVLPATTVMTPMGTYINNVLPYPVNIVQSAQMARGKAVIGIAKKYFMGLGIDKSGRLEYSDEYKFLEDLRTYRIKLYGNGEPLDNNAFQYLDVSGLQPKTYRVTEMSTEPNATLASFSIGDLTLTPTFSNASTTYTTTTENATDTITATTTVEGATVVIKNGNTTVTSGSAATWASGSNTVTATVTNGTATKIYTVTVTKVDTTLSALSIGSVTLSPTFAAGTTVYTGATTNATNTITATASDNDATVVIKNGLTPVTSGSSATWETGENTVTVEVTNGGLTKTYTITVTKS